MNINHFRKVFERYQKQLADDANRNLFSSFHNEADFDRSRIREVWLQRSHKLTINQDFLQNLLNFEALQPPHFSSPVHALANPERILTFCRNFFEIIGGNTHSETCELLPTFKLKFQNQNTELGQWESLFESTLIQCRLPRNEVEDIFRNFKEHFLMNDIMNGFEILKSNKSKHLFVFRRYVCYLHAIKGFKLSKLCQLVPLTKNQIKKTLELFRRGYFNEMFSERRGQHKKQRALISSEHIEWLRQYLAERDAPRRIESIKSEFVNNFPDCRVSYSCFRHAIKGVLGYNYQFVKNVPLEKNSNDNKIYRFWWVHSFLKHLLDDNIVISIDESSFSGYNRRARAWQLPNSTMNIEENFRTGCSNITLLLASCQKRIRGFYLVEGSIDSIIYLDFLQNLINSVRSQTEPGKRIVVIMDNAMIHTNLIMSCLFKAQNIEVIYTAKYSPETHFIEHLFARIKHQIFNVLGSREK